MVFTYNEFGGIGEKVDTGHVRASLVVLSESGIVIRVRCRCSVVTKRRRLSCV